MFDNLDEVQVTKKVNYLQSGVHTVKIVDVNTSGQREGYEGTPYTEFKVSNQDGITYIKMFGKDKNSSEKAIDVRKKVFKEFLIATGTKSFSNVSTAIKETKGKKIKVGLAKREY